MMQRIKANVAYNVRLIIDRHDHAYPGSYSYSYSFLKNISDNVYQNYSLIIELNLIQRGTSTKQYFSSFKLFQANLKTDTGKQINRHSFMRFTIQVKRLQGTEMMHHLVQALNLFFQNFSFLFLKIFLNSTTDNFCADFLSVLIQLNLWLGGAYFRFSLGNKFQAQNEKLLKIMNFNFTQQFTAYHKKTGQKMLFKADFQNTSQIYITLQRLSGQIYLGIISNFDHQNFLNLIKQVKQIKDLYLAFKQSLLKNRYYMPEISNIFQVNFFVSKNHQQKCEVGSVKHFQLEFKRV